MTDFEVYKMYHALKLHFTPNSGYDFVKNGGNLNRSYNSYLYEKTNWAYVKIKDKYGTRGKIFSLYTSNFLMKDKTPWITYMTGEEAKENFLKYQGYKESLNYFFTNEVDHLLKSFKNPNDMLKFGNDLPRLYEKMEYGEVNVYTVILMNKVLGFIDYWMGHHDVMFRKFCCRVKRFSPLFVVDDVEIKNIIIKLLKENENG